MKQEDINKIEDVAGNFVSGAICDWGQPDEERIAKVQAVLDMAGFEAKAMSWPVFGGIWYKPCEGKDGEEATVWLKNLTDTMLRGKFEKEREHVKNEIIKRIEV